MSDTGAHISTQPAVTDGYGNSIHASASKVFFPEIVTELPEMVETTNEIISSVKPFILAAVGAALGTIGQVFTGEGQKKLANQIGQTDKDLFNQVSNGFQNTFGWLGTSNSSPSKTDFKSSPLFQHSQNVAVSNIHNSLLTGGNNPHPTSTPPNNKPGAPVEKLGVNPRIDQRSHQYGPFVEFDES